MTSVQDGYEFINVIKDGKVGKFRLRVQGKPLINSKSGQMPNGTKDIWIYKGSKGAATSQEQPATSSHLVTPLRVVAHPQSQQGQGVTSSQRYIVTPSSRTIISTPQIYTTTQSRMVTTPKIVTSSQRPLPNEIRMTTSQPKVSVFPPKTLTRPRIIGSSLQQVQVAQLQVSSCQFVDLDDDLSDVALVDVDEDPLGSDSKDRQFQCNECSAHFESKQELEKHEHNHLGEVNYICDQCGKEFSMKKSFEDHIKAHATEKKFECDVCHKRFDYRDNLIFHMRIHDEVKSYKCHLCQKKFGNKSMRDHHILKHTAVEKPSPSLVPPDVGKNSTVFPSEDNEIPLFKCDMCPRGLTSKESLEAHKKTHIQNGRVPELLGKKNPSPVRTGHKITPPIPPEMNKVSTLPRSWKYDCPKCGKVFLKEHYYKTHVAMCADAHNNSLNTVNCSFCKKNYAIPKQAKEDGSSGLKFICEACCTFLAQKSQFSGFTPRLENRFICNKCDKCFASEEQLRKHLDNHISEKKILRCNKCDKCFGNENALMAHKESHKLEKKKPSSDLVSGRSKDSKNRKNIQTHTNDKDSHKSANKKRNSPQESSDSKRAKTLNCKSGNKGKRSLSSKESPKRNDKKELPVTSEQSGQKRRRSVSREAKESHTPQKRGKLNTGTVIIREMSDPLEVTDPLEITDPLGGDISDSNSDVDMEESSDESFMEEEEEEEGLPNLKVFVKQEPDDFDEPEYIMENCTVFNPAVSGGKTKAAFTIPDRVIKKEDSDDDDDDEMGKISIKQEKLSDDEMTFKEEHDFDLLGISVKEEKLEEEELLMPDDFEFTPFGDPLKSEEDLLHMK